MDANSVFERQVTSTAVLGHLLREGEDLVKDNDLLDTPTCKVLSHLSSQAQLYGQVRLIPSRPFLYF